jgi:serine/threonine protein kinase
MTAVGPSDFIVLSCLGKGSFGCVYLVKCKTNAEFYAMKVINKQKLFSNNMTKYV